MSTWRKRAGSMGERKTNVVRPRDDFYPTPTVATVAYLRGGPLTGGTYLPHAVWEPACGDGAIAKVLARYGHDVIAHDLNDHGYGQHGQNFLETTVLAAPAIVTNPPFALADQFAEHAVRLGAEVIAMFLRLNFLEGQRRGHWFRGCPPARVLVFSNRLTLAPKGSGITTGGPTAFAWFEWRRGYRGAPQVDFIFAPAEPVFKEDQRDVA